jgi:hypothetical protein
MEDDVDRDGRTDLMLLVRVADLKIACGDTVIRLRGETRDGMAIEGSEAITVTGCGPPAKDTAAPGLLRRGG